MSPPRDGGDVWRGRAAYETDRPLSGGADHGIDRMVLQADGPIGHKLKAVGIIDLNAQLDGDPSSAPAPTDPLDPRSTTPYPLPHSSTETWTAGGKLTVPFTEPRGWPPLRPGDHAAGVSVSIRHTSTMPNYGAGSRTDGKLLTGHLQLLPPTQKHPPALRRPAHRLLRQVIRSRDGRCARTTPLAASPARSCTSSTKTSPSGRTPSARARRFPISARRNSRATRRGESRPSS